MSRAPDGIRRKRSPARASTPKRPVRGAPEQTRARLVAAAADEFNGAGYDGTDSNRIAHAAGYAPGTFYKHFADKQDVFRAVYRDWASREWRDLLSAIDQTSSKAERAERIIDVLFAYHERWRTFRASLRVLLARDPKMRVFHAGQRKKQLAMLERLGRGKKRTREEQALFLFTLERAADAVADGEIVLLRLDRKAVRGLLVGAVRARL